MLDAGTVAVDSIAIVAAVIDQALTKGLSWFLVVVVSGIEKKDLRWEGWLQNWQTIAY